MVPIDGASWPWSDRRRPSRSGRPGAGADRFSAAGACHLGSSSRLECRSRPSFLALKWTPRKMPRKYRNAGRIARTMISAYGYADHFRHQERRSAHDGGHDLAAGGGRSLDRAGKLRGIAGLLHHRDGDGTGGNGVADGGTGDHAAQGGGDDRDLRRTAGSPADQRVRAVDEEVGDTGGLKERAEDDEQRDVGRADGDRGADDAGWWYRRCCRPPDLQVHAARR